MKNKTLVVLAAGMGSRFGGLKQTEKFGPSGEFIIDYSIFDAIKNGFNKVVFIIKEENYNLFKETIGKRIEKHVDVEYAFQNFDNVLKEYSIPSERIKPLGTAHAILCAKKFIKDDFVIINSDDFYGYDAFKVASECLDKSNNEVTIVGYKVVNTLTDNGSVKRGVLKTKNNKLEKIIESKIETNNKNIICEPLDGSSTFRIDSDTLVSMNMIAFPKDFIDYIYDNFENFLKNSNLLKDEYLIPDVITKAILEKRYNVCVKKTNSKWVGVTYKEDTPSVKNYINYLIDKGVYNYNLWS